MPVRPQAIDVLEELRCEGDAGDLRRKGCVCWHRGLGLIDRHG